MEVTKKPEEETALYREYSPLQRIIRKTYLATINISNLRKILSLVGVVILWHIVSKYKIPPFQRVPLPSEVLLEAIKYVPTHMFLTNVTFSMGRVFVGFTAACVLRDTLGDISGLEAPC